MHGQSASMTPNDSSACTQPSERSPEGARPPAAAAPHSPICPHSLAPVLAVRWPERACSASRQRATSAGLNCSTCRASRVVGRGGWSVPRSAVDGPCSAHAS